MNEVKKNKVLVERFNKYSDYRKESSRVGSSFTEQLNKKIGQDLPRSKNAGRGQVDEMRSRYARRFRPPTLARPKTITKQQTERLAQYAPVIEAAARKFGVPVELICGVILQESGGNSRALSPAGACGLMQLMPGTARRFGVKNSFDPIQNIAGGTRYLRFLMDRFNGRLDLVLAGYNAGEGNVAKYGNRIPPFKETQGYVPNVLGYTQTIINLLYAKANNIELPSHARRV